MTGLVLLILCIFYRPAPYSSYCSNNSTVNVAAPKVSDRSRKIYEDYQKVGKDGPAPPSELDMKLYNSYIEQKYM